MPVNSYLDFFFVRKERPCGVDWRFFRKGPARDAGGMHYRRNDKGGCSATNIGSGTTYQLVDIGDSLVRAREVEGSMKAGAAPVFLEADDGTRVFLQKWRQQGKSACSWWYPKRAEWAPSLVCVPPETVQALGYFSDPECRTEVVRPSVQGCPKASMGVTYRSVKSKLVCSEDWHFFELLMSSRPAGSPVYVPAPDGGECKQTIGYESEEEHFELGKEIPLSSLLTGTTGAPVGTGRLKLLPIETSAGRDYQRLLWDDHLQARCLPVGVSADRFLCLPGLITSLDEVASEFFADGECKKQLLKHESCEGPFVGVSSIGQVFRLEVYPRGAPLFVQSNGICVPAVRAPEGDLWLPGPPLPQSEFVEMKLVNR